MTAELAVRVALAGFFHESNTFCPNVTTIEDYRAARLLRGDEIVASLAGTDSEMAGFLEGAYEAVPAYVAWAWPKGPLTGGCFVELLDQLLQALREAEPFAGVLLTLHGAMVAQGVSDADAVILDRVREVAGDRPVMATFDLHANLHPRMADAADALIGYRTYPHVDLADRGREAARLMERTLAGEVKPVCRMAKAPLQPHIMTMLTAGGPAAELFADADRLRDRDGLLSTSIALGFAYADVEHLGLSAVAVADGDGEAAEAAARALAESAWARRERFWVDLPSPAEAVARAVASEVGPVVLADIGDNVGGGTPGDGTFLLSELVRAEATDAVVVLYDPEAVRRCAEAGVNGEPTLAVGGRQDRLHGPAVTVTGRVQALTDGVFRNVGPMRDGLLDDQGPTAVLAIPTGLLVLTSKRMPSWNLEQLRHCGIEPTRQKIIVCKGALAHRAAYAPIAAAMIDVDTDGVTPADYRKLPYRRVSRPLYRLDEQADFGSAT